MLPSTRVHVRTLATKVPSETAKKGYSHTLLLPTTKFGPKIPSGQQRDDLIERSSQALYQWQAQAKDGSNSFTLHDGPPYANGDLHLGHSLNKILKDLINRFQLIYHDSRINYRPGWDCHGLPIEMKATNMEAEIKQQKSKSKKKDSTITSPQLLAVEIRAACRNLASTMISSQRKQFKDFAIMTDFENPYVTMSHDYEINQLRIFRKLIENGLLSRQMKPVWWGCETQTALAEAELEYNNDHKSTSIYVKFPIHTPEFLAFVQEKFAIDAMDKVNLLIWTSTPWTIPANKAICVNKDLEYTLLHKDSEYMVVAQSLAEQLSSLDPEWTPVDGNVTFSGKSLVGVEYTNPATNTDVLHPILHGDHVIASAGSGLVHTAPAHGGEDYLIGKKSGLDIVSSVDGHGKFIKENIPVGFHSLEGGKVTDSATIWQCIDILKENGMIYNINKNFRHSYPYDWRSKTPVIQRATPQWFVNVEKIKSTALKALEHVQFLPESGKNRLPLFINNRNEWCISRQRTWGVPLPIIHNKSTNVPIDDLKVIDHIITKIDEYGTDEWFVVEDDISRWLPKEFEHEGHLYAKGQDTMDVWFDSGTSWSTLSDGKLDEAMMSHEPLADVYLEGSDQHRGWFQSSLLNKIIASGSSGRDFKPVAPFKKIITHGFTLDSKNDKMSKSKGNIILPQHAMEGGGKPFLPKLGTDGLRLWVASSNYISDVNVTSEVLTRVFENVKKLRVTFKYLLGNLNDFQDPVAYDDLNPFDKYALSRLHTVQRNCIEFYNDHNFSRVVGEINNHMNSDLSALYFDISKDCLYTDSKNSLRRRSIQTVLREVLRTYIGILAPIQPILTQEVWEQGSNIFGRDENSPFMLGKWQDFYQLPAKFENRAIEKEFELIWNIRDAAYIELEALRVNGDYKNRLETQISLNFKSNSSIRHVLSGHLGFLDDYFLVSKVSLDHNLSHKYQPQIIHNIHGEDVEIQVGPSSHAKCPRCWKFNAPKEDHLCLKCESVVH